MKNTIVAIVAFCLYGLGTAIQAQNAISAAGNVRGQEALTEANKVTITGTPPVSVTGSPTITASSPVAISIAEATTSAAGSMSAADKTKLDGITASAHYLGEPKDGGIIFYIYRGSDGLEHGLIVALTESTAVWFGSMVVGANRTWDGAYNTDLMPTGAGTARDYVTSMGEGWYLPSIDELCILYNNRFHVNNALNSGGNTLLSITAYYWSSTEYNLFYAWGFNFSLGFASTTNDKEDPYNVRAVRSF